MNHIKIIFFPVSCHYDQSTVGKNKFSKTCWGPCLINASRAEQSRKPCNGGLSVCPAATSPATLHAGVLTALVGEAAPSGPFLITPSFAPFVWEPRVETCSLSSPWRSLSVDGMQVRSWIVVVLGPYLWRLGLSTSSSLSSSPRRGTPDWRREQSQWGRRSLLKVKWTVRGTIPAIKNNYVDHVAPWKSANCAPSEKSWMQHRTVAVLLVL